MKNIEDYILKLQNKIRRHQYLYHTLNLPDISDEEYDLLMLELKKLENKYKNVFEFNNSPSMSIGFLGLREFGKFDHITPMLSLESVYTVKDFFKFYKKIKCFLKLKKIFFCSELKIDGLAINLIYKHGSLFRAMTRGDGYIGEDVTNNVRMISSIPNFLLGTNIPSTLEVRGEVFILKSDFLRLNQQAFKLGKNLFSNTRNLAAGFLRQKNCMFEGLKNLMFCCYGLGYCSKNSISDSHFLRLKQLKDWGFPISAYNILYSSSYEIVNFYNCIQKKRKFLDFDIDGIVVKVDSIICQNLLSTTSVAPKWAIACKFLDEIKTTQVVKVLYQIGRTGVITPVAELLPIKISGVCIKRVSLHNFNEIKRLDLHIGDYVAIKRAGAVVPKIVNVILGQRSSIVKKINFPKYCPECSSILDFCSLNSVQIRCISGLKCLSQFKKLLHHFCSKKGFNISGLGPKIIDKLVDLGYVKNLFDLFNLNLVVLARIDNIGDKKAKNIILSIHNSKNICFEKFICSLGIPEVGRVLSKKISNFFSTVSDFMDASKNDFFSISGVGWNIANSLYNFTNSQFNKTLIFNLLKVVNVYSNKL